MSHRIMDKVVMAGMVLACSLITAFACVKGPTDAGTCGVNADADCYNPISRVCQTKQSCDGAPTYYSCTLGNTQKTCQRFSWSKVYTTHYPDGVTTCAVTGPVFIGTVNATCQDVVSSVGPGC